MRPQRRLELVLFWMLFVSSMNDVVAQTSRVSSFGRRYDAFRYLLQRRGLPLNPSPEPASAFRDPAHSIVIVLGDVRRLQGLKGEWASFVSHGGTLLIATEQSTEDLFDDLGVRVSAGRLTVTPDKSLGNHRDCPYVNELAADHPLFVQVKMLALNVSAMLEGPLPQRSAIAKVDAPYQLDGQPLPASAPVLAATTIDAGRVCVVADTGLFINEMQLLPDIDNTRFLANLVDWLIADRDPATLSVWMVENGRPIDAWIDERFRTGNWQSNFSKLTGFSDEALTLVNEAIRFIEEENLPNKSLQQAGTLAGRLSVRRTQVLGLAALALALLGYRWLHTTRPAPPATPAVEAVSGAADDRWRGITTGPDLTIAARILAREHLNTVPPTAATGSWWRRWREHRRQRRLQQLATGKPGRPVTAAEFAKLFPAERIVRL